MKNLMKIAVALSLLGTCQVGFAMGDGKSLEKTEKNTQQLYDFDLFCAVQRFGDIFMEILRSAQNDYPGIGIGDNRLVWPEPYSSDQTKQGLFFDLSGCELTTPWGSLKLGNWRHCEKSANLKGFLEKVREIFLEKFTVKCVNEFKTIGGVTTGIYAIISFGKNQLPEAIPSKYADNCSREDVHNAWNAMKQRYENLRTTRRQTLNAASSLTSSASSSSASAGTAQSTTARSAETIATGSSSSSSSSSAWTSEDEKIHGPQIPATLTQEAQALFSSTIPTIAALAMTAMAMQTKSAH